MAMTEEQRKEIKGVMKEALEENQASMTSSQARLAEETTAKLAEKDAEIVRLKQKLESDVAVLAEETLQALKVANADLTAQLAEATSRETLEGQIIDAINSLSTEGRANLAEQIHGWTYQEPKAEAEKVDEAPPVEKPRPRIVIVVKDSHKYGRRVEV